MLNIMMWQRSERSNKYHKIKCEQFQNVDEFIKVSSVGENSKLQSNISWRTEHFILVGTSADISKLLMQWFSNFVEDSISGLCTLLSPNAQTAR